MTVMVESVRSLLYPLSDFWDLEQAPIAVEAIDPARMPQPYRRLLVHGRDMTPTLEAHWRSPLHLRVMRKRIEDDCLYRQVTLRTAAERPVEFGAIKIHLGRFAGDARRKIIECGRPLGGILAEFGIEHHSAPTGYFRLPPNGLIEEAFPGEVGDLHYGRHNVLSGPTGVLAEVVEILPRMSGEADSQ